MSSEIKVEYVAREVIENKLLAALNETGNVAILASERDLVVMIEAPRKSTDPHARQMAEDYGKLRRAAF